MPWQVRITGDMTLSVVDEDGVQVLKVDMLRHGTMRAGTDGAGLARALNDLTVLASVPQVLAGREPEALPHPGLPAGAPQRCGPPSPAGGRQGSGGQPSPSATLRAKAGGRVFAERQFPAAQARRYVGAREALLRAWPRRDELGRA